MNKRNMLALGAAVFMTGCLQTRGELAQNEEKRAVQTQVQSLQKQKADADQQVMALETQIRALNGRIETLEHQNEMTAKARDENAQKSATLENRIKALEDGILQLGGDVEALKSAPKAQASKKSGGDDDKKGPYEQGDDYFNDKDWKKAIASFQKYLENNPKGENVASATYKIGVSLAELKMTKEAKVFLEEVVEKYPKSKAARQATFRLNQMKKK